MAMTVTVLNSSDLMAVYPRVSVLATSDPADNIKLAKAYVHLSGDPDPIQYNGEDGIILAIAVTGGVADEFSFDVSPIIRSYFEQQNGNGGTPASFVGALTGAIVGTESTAVVDVFEVWVEFYDYVDGGGYDVQNLFAAATTVVDLKFFNALWGWREYPPSTTLDIQTDPSYTALTKRPFSAKTLIDGFEYLHFWNHANPSAINAFKITARNGNTSVYTQTVTHGIATEALGYIAVGYGAIRTGYTTGGGITVEASTGTPGTALTDWDIQFGVWEGAPPAFTPLGTKYTYYAEDPCADSMRLYFTNRYGVQDAITMSQSFVQERSFEKTTFQREYQTNAIRKATDYGWGMTGGLQSFRYTVHYLCPESELEWVNDLLNSSFVAWLTTGLGTAALVPVVILADTIVWGSNVNKVVPISFDVILSPTNQHP